MKTNEKLKIALLQSATALFIHLDNARLAVLAVALWDELGAALSSPHGQAQLRS